MRAGTGGGGGHTGSGLLLTTMTARLSIVVPAGPGDEAWRPLLPALVRGCIEIGLPAQIVLVLPDAATTPFDLPAGVTLIHAPTGRASQLNAGARATDGEWLWFVHADSVLGRDTLRALQAFVASGRDAIGYFDLRFLDDGPALIALNTAGAWVRSRVLGLPFGDQALVMPRRVFDRLGGFPAVSGEDHALVWAARRARVPVRPVRARVYTSARRYAARGWVATTARHLWLTALQAWRFARMRSAA
ncbi:glycosyltransferase [Lysobacter korlensis]|uniref:Glycosyltransferase n=1 Tax=Lysobacter korlensis TaxID=553636 RepID=A0ABV6RSG4_9GAMM